MNFFEHEANARRLTGRLLLYFLLAVAFTVLAINAGMFVLGKYTHAVITGTWFWHEWSPQAVIGTLMIIVGGSALEYLQLRGGGRALAEMIGARGIELASDNLQERQFINVVAEMSIASGVSPPQLYVMDNEPGINAFVAGLTPDETVMVVTAGALEAFNRDELQAVVGHEFSHILNGDMRLNVRLLALLAGILAIGQVGGFLLRMSSSSSSSYSSRSDRDRRGGIVYVWAVGLMLWLVGSIGLFFGRLIKAAISRQREFLADASSVQFTRNPDGLAGALLKIKNGAEQSWLNNMRAESMSHMCFGEALEFSNLFATHPPLEERVGRIGKKYLIIDRAQQRAKKQNEETAADVAEANGLSPHQGPSFPPPALNQTASGFASPAPAPVRELPPIAYEFPQAKHGATEAVPEVIAATAPTVAERIAGVGQVNPQQLASAQELYRRLPAAVLQAITTTEGARALLYAVIAAQNHATAEQSSAFVQQHEPDLAVSVAQLRHALKGFDAGFALPLTELALPRLQLLAPTAQREYVARLQAFALLDKRLSVFEFALLMLLRKKLRISPRASAITLAKATPLLSVVVATLLRASNLQGEKLERTHLRLLRTVVASSAMAAVSLPAPEFTRLPRFALSVQALAGLPLMDKKAVLELAATAVLADGEVKVEEYELLRVVAALLDCPMPLLA